MANQLSFMASKKTFCTNVEFISVDELQNIKSLKDKEEIQRVKDAANFIYGWKDFNTRFEVGILRKFQLFILSHLSTTNLAVQIANVVSNHVKKYQIVAPANNLPIENFEETKPKSEEKKLGRDEITSHLESNKKEEKVKPQGKNLKWYSSMRNRASASTILMPI